MSRLSKAAESLDSGPELLETAAMLPRSKSFNVVVLFLLLLPLPLITGRSPRQANPVDYLQVAGLSGSKGGNLVAAVYADPATFNRFLTSTLAHTIIADRISSDLVHINRVTFDLEPSLAKSWDVDRAGTSYTIHLRRGLRFSDGSPFTVDDVLFTFQVLQDSRIENVFAGQVKVDGTFPQITKLDPLTLRLAFSRPVGMGLRMLDSVPILPAARLKKAYLDGGFDSAWGPGANPAEIAGMGPFRLKEYKRGERVVLERNPFYWKKDRNGQILPYLDTITFLIIPDQNTEALRFKTGELDLVNNLSPENYADLRRSQTEGGYRLRNLGPGLLVDFLWFNLNRAAGPSGKPHVSPEKQLVFEKTEFRRAVAFALDRQGMARSVLLGLGTPQYGPISSGNKVWYHAAIPRTLYNPTRASALLDQIGIRDSDGDGIREFGSSHQPMEFTLLTTRGFSARERIARVIQENLAKVGIRVHVQLVLPNELATRVMESFDYEAILYGFSPIDVAPDLLTDVWNSSGEHHFWFPRQARPATAWEAQLDRLTTTLIRSSEPGVRKTTFDQIQDLWAGQMPAIPTVAANILPGWSNRVGNVRPSILAPYLLWNSEELTLSR